MPGFPSTGGGSSGINWQTGVGLGLGGIGAILPFILGGGTGIPKDLIQNIQTQGQKAQATGEGLTKSGLTGMAPVMQYLTKLAGGDPGLALEATAPQRSRVIDQYDTARRTVAQFTGRGQSQAGALTEMAGKEASDIGVLTAEAQTKGVEDLGAMAKNLLSAGMGFEDLAGKDFSTALQGFIEQAKLQGQQAQGLGEGLGSLALSFLEMGGAL